MSSKFSAPLGPFTTAPTSTSRPLVRLPARIATWCWARPEVAFTSLGYRVLPLHHPLAATSIQEQGMHCSCGARLVGSSESTR